MKAAEKNEIQEMALSSIDEILIDMKAGKPVIIVDDEDRENEGDVIIAAEMASPENINFLAREARGLICLPMEEAMIKRLGLELMGRGDNTHHRTAFTVSIEAKEGVTTGISAADRSRTILTAIDPASGPQDIATPGHVFPLIAREGGVLVRAGHTEAAVDLARMAGFSGAGVICEIMNDDGTMARLPDLLIFAQKHGLKVGTIADLIAYRRRRDCYVKRIYEGKFQHKKYGEFALSLYANTIEYAEHVVLSKGSISGSGEPILVRMHAVDVFEDILQGSDGTLQNALEMISKEGRGVVVLIRNPAPKVLSQKLGVERHGETLAPLKDYGIGAQILIDLGVKNMTLLSNHARNIASLEGYDLHVSGFRALS